MRPANIVTALADILAGFCAAGGILVLNDTIPTFSPASIGWLLLSTFGLYGGGVVFNDVFDASLDAEERPERAIPSGRVTLMEAKALGTLLFAGGIFSALQAGIPSGIIAIFIAIFALVYDAWAKHSIIFGPLFMGCCRGGNLLLGCSAILTSLPDIWFLAFIPILYIGSITLISQGEVHGGSKKTGTIALVLMLVVTAILLSLGFSPLYNVLTALPFLLLFAYLVIPPFFRAVFQPEATVIKKAVKRGIISLIILNSAIAAGFGGLLLGIMVLALLPLSFGLSRLFAVT